jgi:hypothetical protein
MAAKTYGLTIEEVLHLRSLPCAICGDPHKSGLGGHVIDHDHATGIVRGALCNHCNQCLGRAKDRVDVLLAAAEYLLQHSTKPIVIDRAAVPTVRSFLTFQGEFIP